MIFLGIAIWAVFVYSTVAAVGGSPVLNVIRRADAAIFDKAADLFDEHGPDAAEVAEPIVAEYLRVFFWRSMIALVAGLTEFAIIMALVLKDRATLIVWILLVKQMISFPLEHLQRRKSANQLRVIRNLPSWFLLWTRGSYAVSALAFLTLFLIEMKLIN